MTDSDSEVPPMPSEARDFSKAGSLEAALLRQKVYVEATTSSGGSNGRRTILYTGVYAGKDKIGNQEFLILQDASYRTVAGVCWDNNKDGIESSFCAVNIRNVVSICFFDGRHY